MEASVKHVLRVCAVMLIGLVGCRTAPGTPGGATTTPRPSSPTGTNAAATASGTATLTPATEALVATSITTVTLAAPPPPATPLPGEFALEIEGDIWVMNADGTRRLQLTGGPASDFDPHWSPDGKQVVFRTERGVRGPDPEGTGFDCLFIVNADGSGERQLYPPDAATAGGLFPSWGSNNLIAFSGLPSEGSGETIYTIRPDGTGLIDIGHPAGASAEGAAWSPDSQVIAFGSHRGDGRWQIWSMNADGSNKRQLTHVLVRPGGQYGAHFGAWSPDGKQIFFSSDHEGSLDIYVMNADGSGQTRLTDQPGTQSVEALLPDGLLLITDSSAGGRLPDWKLVHTDGSPTGDVPQLAGANAPLSWRPLP
jgi:Tol biopolymer transport system component